MMLNNKKYIQILFTLFGIVLALVISYIIYFSRHYPLPITNRISFDAKIQFIYQHIDINDIDTIILGSSLGLNDVQGPFLEKVSKKAKHVLNLSVFEASAFQVEQLFELRSAFPNLKRIVYSGQFSDLYHPARFKNYDSKFIKKYIMHKLNPIEYAKLLFDSCKNIFFCINRQKEWANKYMKNNKFSYLGFDYTGSVPLHIYGKDIIPHRWKDPHGAAQNPKSYEAIARMAKQAQKEHIQFYFVQQPYRQALIDKFQFVHDVMYALPKRMINTISPYNGKFISLYQTLRLRDKYFADRSHLNDKGSVISAEAIGKFIDKSEENK